MWIIEVMRKLDFFYEIILENKVEKMCSCKLAIVHYEPLAVAKLIMLIFGFLSEVLICMLIMFFSSHVIYKAWVWDMLI